MKSFVRPWIYKEEMLLSEQFAYGHREILLSSNNIELDKLIVGELQHGWTLNTKDLVQSIRRARDRKGRLYPLYVWSKVLADKFIDLGHKNIQAIGSPWAHYAQSYKIKESHNRPIAIYFPSHSFYGADISDDTKASIEEIQELVGSTKVIVCLYWLDYIDPRKTRLYKSKGWETVCLGYRGAPATDFPWSNVGGRVNFLPNLFKLLLNCQLAISDEVGTAFWAANSLNINTYLTKQSPIMRSIWTNQLEMDNGRKVKQIEEIRQRGVLIHSCEILLPSGCLHELSRI